MCAKLDVSSKQLEHAQALIVSCAAAAAWVAVIPMLRIRHLLTARKRPGYYEIDFSSISPKGAQSCPYRK